MLGIRENAKPIQLIIVSGRNMTKMEIHALSAKQGTKSSLIRTTLKMLVVWRTNSPYSTMIILLVVRVNIKSRVIVCLG